VTAGDIDGAKGVRSEAQRVRAAAGAFPKATAGFEADTLPSPPSPLKGPPSAGVPSPGSSNRPSSGLSGSKVSRLFQIHGAGEGSELDLSGPFVHALNIAGPTLEVNGLTFTDLLMWRWFRK